jgi:AcrR family transcriptional regulator
MVQLRSVDPLPEEPAGQRERNRLARHRAYLAAALRIVSDEGLDALTMQRLAAEVGASVGSTYTYFPSKGALVAEVQREAVERLASSVLVLGADVDRAVAGDDASLAAVVAFGRFWLTAGGPYPEEMRLLLLLLSDATDAVPPEDAARVVPAVLRLTGLLEGRLRAAADAGALAPGDADRRTIALAAALTGCLQLATVQRWDEDLLDPVAAGRLVLDALLTGWGADPAAITAAHAVVDRLESTGPLARPLPGGPER